MTRPILILGGYGNFGKRIAAALDAAGYATLVAGRDMQKAQALAQTLTHATALQLDIRAGLAEALAVHKPAVVIHTAGPFQGSDYAVAEACIAAGVHYLDLADGRAFVGGFDALDAAAKAAGVLAITGASSVPALSSAVVEHFAPEFSRLDSIDYGICPGQKTERGLATLQGVFSTIGKPFAPVLGQKRYGWQDVRRVRFPRIGTRWVANCDIPDLDLLPARYGFIHIRFGAGIELAPLHFLLWGLSWLVRLGIPLRLERQARWMLPLGDMCNPLGSDDGGMYVFLRGLDHSGEAHERHWFILAFSGDGPHIPTIPAIVLAKKLVDGVGSQSGAFPCLGSVTLAEYLEELKDYKVTTHAQ